MAGPPPSSAPSASTASGDLAATLARGDHRAAVAGLMRSHGAELLRFCLSMLGDRDQADDVHQSVFVDAFAALGGLHDASKARSWLYGIARHRCLDALKARRRWYQRFVPGAEPPAAASAVAPALHETVETDGRAAALEGCLRKLAPHVRAAVLLRYEDDLGYQELARMSRENPKALQMRVARGLAALRACLDAKLLEATS